MPNWIKDAAAKMNEEKERRRTTEEYADARQKALIASGPLALQKLSEAVEKGVALFNETFPDPQNRLKELERIGNQGFQVLRSHTPAYTLHVRLEGARIKYQILAVGKTEDSFGIGLGQNSEVQLLKQGSVIAFEDASKELIAPALLGFEDQ